MKEEGYECEIYAIDSQVQIENDPHYIVGTKVTYHRNIFSYISYIIRQRNCIIYSNSLTLKTLIVGLFGKKTIFMPHDSLFGSTLFKKCIIVFFYRFFSRIRVNNIKEVIELDTIKKWLWVKIPLVVSLDFYEPKPAYPEKNVIISLGNLIPKKRPEFLLRALKIVKDSGYTFTLKVIGEDRLRNHFPYSYVQLIDKYNLTENIEVCGFIPHELLASYTRDAFLYINTSTQEWFCLALYEMSMAGLFPIIPRILSFDNVFSDRALYYDPDSHEELAKYIIQVIHEKEKYHDLALKNQEYIKKEYNYDNIKNSLRNLLLDVAK